MLPRKLHNLRKQRNSSRFRAPAAAAFPAMAAAEPKQLQHQQHHQHQLQQQQQQQQHQALVCGSKMVRVLMVMLALGLSVYTIAPAVYWHVVAEDGDVLSQWVLQCPPCPTSGEECSKTAPSPAFLAETASKLLALAQKLNSTPVDCHGSNRCMKESMAQTQEQLQREGLKLQKEAKSAQLRANSSGYFDASKKTVDRNQRGVSEKGTTSQQSRTEAELAKETTRANLWEKRARDLGWKAKSASYQKYKKYIQMLDGGA